MSAKKQPDNRPSCFLYSMIGSAAFYATFLSCRKSFFSLPYPRACNHIAIQSGGKIVCGAILGNVIPVFPHPTRRNQRILKTAPSHVGFDYKWSYSIQRALHTTVVYQQSHTAQAQQNILPTNPTTLARNAATTNKGIETIFYKKLTFWKQYVIIIPI